MSRLAGKTVLLIISGGIAAYKSLELIRLLKKAGVNILPILTKGGEQFVTPLSVSALAEHAVYTDLWSLKDENEMGHIRLSREADLIVVAPASANFLAKMAQGIADDLASTTLLAANKPVMAFPAMNPEMWANPATQRNIDILKSDGIHIINPSSGAMACGEIGTGRLPEATEMFSAIESFLTSVGKLTGRKAIVTSGPTYEAIDPVRFIGNHSSGKQGHAIAAALAREGADVTLITGPVSLPDPEGVKTIHITSADDMLAAVTKSLPADIAVCAAAVSDWKVENAQSHKMKKRHSDEAPRLNLTENPDILAAISKSANRPQLVIGFAAETENAVKNAQEKLLKKGCDWILANQVGKTEFPVFGDDNNQVTLVTRTTTNDWPILNKKDVASRLVAAIIDEFSKGHSNDTERKNGSTG